MEARQLAYLAREHEDRQPVTAVVVLDMANPIERLEDLAGEPLALNRKPARQSSARSSRAG